MKIIPTNNDILLTKEKQEQVENKKQEIEMKFIGKFVRKRGLKLYSYNPKTDEIEEIEIKPKTDEKEIILVDDKLSSVENEGYDAIVNPNLYYFYALNNKTARKRVDKYLAGKIKKLSNLVPAGQINFFENGFL